MFDGGFYILILEGFVSNGLSSADTDFKMGQKLLLRRDQSQIK